LGTGRRLLLADDSVTIQKVINLTFADEGMEVTAVGNGDLAMEQLSAEPPDIIMVDVHMPGLNGYQICERVRQTEHLKHIPVILLVGSFEPFDEEEARRVGADDFLTKPFQSIRQLVGKVGSLLKNRPNEGDAPGETSEAQPADESQDLIQTALPADAPIEYAAIAPEPTAWGASSTNFTGDVALDDDLIEARAVSSAPEEKQDTYSGVPRATVPLSSTDLTEFGHAGTSTRDLSGVQPQPSWRDTDAARTVAMSTEEIDATSGVGNVSQNFEIKLEDQTPSYEIPHVEASNTEEPVGDYAFSASGAADTAPVSEDWANAGARSGTVSVMVPPMDFDMSDDDLLDLGDIDSPRLYAAASESVLDLGDFLGGPQAPPPTASPSGPVYPYAEQSTSSVNTYSTQPLSEPLVDVGVRDMSGAAMESPAQMSVMPVVPAGLASPSIVEQIPLPSARLLTGFESQPYVEPVQHAYAGPITLEQIPQSLIEAIAQKVVEHLTNRTIEEIAWEVVPQLAELHVRREMEKKGN
jgi:CheY-like chemotaxis protein